MSGSTKITHPAAIYEIKVRGSLDESWANWFSEMKIYPGKTNLDNPITSLKGPVIDQSALRGILTRLWDMNLEIISLQQISFLLNEEEPDE